MAQDLTGARDTLLQMATVYAGTQAVHAAAQLGLADQLADGPRAIQDLANDTGAHGPSLARLMRALAALGLVEQVDDGAIALTPLGTLLRSDVPGSLRDAFRFLAGDWNWRSWGQLLYSVRTGNPAFDHVFGMSNFEYWGRDTQAGEIHDAYFQTMSHSSDAPIVAAYDFSRFRTVVDVGGSTGSLLAAILREHSGLRGILFDLPHVVSRSERVLAEAGVADRCAVVGGSFFESVPAGGDAYVLKYVIHDWDDDRARALLRRCREAMDREAVLLVIEQVMPQRLEPGPEAHRITRLDLQMLVMTPGGRERTEQEFRSLLKEAAFELRGVTATASPFHVLEAFPL